MKTRKNIYLVLGILFLLFYILMLVTFLTEFREMVDPESEGFGFFVSDQLWLVPTFLFFRAAYRLKKKLNARTENCWKMLSWETSLTNKKIRQLADRSFNYFI